MTQRIFSIALILATVVYLPGCGTTRSIPAHHGTAKSSSANTQAGGDQQRLPTAQDLDEQLAKHLPGTPRLAEIEDMAGIITRYQPEVVLEILRALETRSSTQLDAMVASGQYTPGLTQWLELTLAVRATLFDSGSVAQAARKWAADHPGHSVDQRAFSDISTAYRSLFPSPARVAVLLPAEGGLVAAGKAIRDGILSAYFENPGHSVLRFYSSGKNTEAAITAYRQAQIEGATQVIGPLRVGSTRALSGQASADLPLLLLNDMATDDVLITPSRGRVNSLTLSQTEEAAAIASRALDQAQKRAIVVVPDDAWGSRIQTAFATQFEAGDGQIVAAATFVGSESNQDELLQHLLKIDASTRRRQDLQSRLGIPLEFEPYRRHDFDFIFLAASPQQGRQIRPLLRFHKAGNIPVYAMGRIFSGRVARASDQDLNGIIFATTPWQLTAAGRSAKDGSNPVQSTNDGIYADLYALGLDAWRTLPWLSLMRNDAGLRFPGATGSLRMLPDGHLQREPAWAQFSAGHPVPYQWAND